MKKNISNYCAFRDSILSTLDTIDKTKTWVYQLDFFFLFGYSKKRNDSGSLDMHMQDGPRYLSIIYGRIDNLSKIEPTFISSDEQIEDIVSIAIQHPELLRGDFVIVIYDKKLEKLICIRDQFGMRPFYFSDNDQHFAFSFNLRYLKILPNWHIEIDPIWIADSISLVTSEKYRTPYRGIFRLAAAHKLIYDNELRIIPYWELTVNKNFENIDFYEAARIFKEKLDKSIEYRVSDSKAVGSELSGGLDSSGLTAIANNYLSQNGIELYAFSHLFSIKSLGKYLSFTDEGKYSSKMVSYLELKNHISCDADGFGIIDTLRQSIFIQSGPVQQIYGIFSDTLYERAQKYGIDTLISGFGGDEGVSSNAYGFFEELKQNRNCSLYAKEMLYRIRKQNRVTRSVKGLIERGMSLDINMIRHMLKNEKKRLNHQLENLAYDQQFGNLIDIPKRYVQMVGVPRNLNLRERQYWRIMHPHVSQRLEYSYFSANAMGTKYVYPLWDVDLLDFYYSLPAHYKFRQGMGRALFREALKGLVPEEIRLRNDKFGKSIPTIRQRFYYDYKNIKQLIVRSRNENKYHYLDYDKLLEWQVKIEKNTPQSGPYIYSSAFYKSLQVLILQEMERTGEFSSGIRC